MSCFNSCSLPVFLFTLESKSSCNLFHYDSPLAKVFSFNSLLKERQKSVMVWLLTPSLSLDAVVPSLSCVRLFVTLWTAACQASLSSLSPGVCSNSHPLSQWCSLTISSSGASLVAQMVKNQPAMQKTGIRSLHQEDPLKKGFASHSSILAWKIP